MKLSENWIREWANPDLSLQALCDVLTMAGLEVDGTEPVAAVLSGVLVGEVLSVDPHPNADKLRICTVNVGADEPLNIVCGAANVTAGMRVPTACVGASLPGFKIKKAKLRGEPSFGMLCSAAELGIAESAAGLLPLPSDAPIGVDINQYLALSDRSIEIDLTPNRGDCLSVLGVARELRALTGCELMPVDIAAATVQFADKPVVKLSQPEACPRYVGRFIRNINPQAQTPLWMQEKLRRSGVRSISPVVDVTNFVLLELGQPMHAFDAAKLDGAIEVRFAKADEQLTLLDEQTIKLDSQSLLIADSSKPLALAGVMGGLDSAVSDSTTDILLESAFFNPVTLAGCARRYGLHTDSSHRFERGVDPELQVQALERATALLLDIVGGEVGAITEVCAADQLPNMAPISLRAEYVNRLLGTKIPSADIVSSLTGLGLTVTETAADVWSVSVPSFRFDIAHEADLIEEVARLYGYHRLDGTAAPTRMAIDSLPTDALSVLQALLVQRGYQEAITYSFVDPSWQSVLEPDLKSISLANPLSQELSVMRTRLWPGLLQALHYNHKRQQADLRLFESGLCFIEDETGAWQQTPMLSAVCCGRLLPEQWAEKARIIDFFDVKADVEAILSASHVKAEFKSEQHPALHPGQTAGIYQNGEQIGLLAALHPAVLKQLNLPDPTFVFELNLSALSQVYLSSFSPLSKFPAIRRDIALLVDESLAVGEMLSYVEQQAGELLTKLQLFDIYRGEGIDFGQKSLALGLTFRAISRNLTESEIESLMSDLLVNLKTKFNAELRA